MLIIYHVIQILYNTDCLCNECNVIVYVNCICFQVPDYLLPFHKPFDMLNIVMLGTDVCV